MKIKRNKRYDDLSLTNHMNNDKKIKRNERNKEVNLLESKINNERNTYILDCAKLTPKEYLSKVNIDSSKGLDESNLLDLRIKYGSNELSKVKEDSLMLTLLKSFFTPFTLILLVVGSISGVVSYFFPSSIEEKNTWYFTPLILLIIILLSGGVSFYQSIKSKRSAKALNKLSENTSTLLRESKKVEVPNKDIVKNDLVYLSAGDMLPSDIKIIESKDLFVNQVALTGENEAKEKHASKEEGDLSKKSIFDLKNIVYRGSSVISGYALGIVISVGENTVFGSLAKKVVTKKEKTPFEKGISSVSKMLLSFLLIMFPLVFLLDGFGIRFTSSGLTSSNPLDLSRWIEGLVFALSVAIGLVPSLLPMQVASNLAKGAYNMSKKKVIVKDINTIQNFGAMDILCTDKTGTLTELESKLDEYFDINNNFDNLDILKMCYLNSYFQSGIKSSIDKALISYVNENNIHLDNILDISSNYLKLDEIPFDFIRKRLSILVKENNTNKVILITKGQSSKMMEVITKVKIDDNKIIDINDDLKEKILTKVKEEESKGKRVILLGIKEYDNKDMTTISLNDESNLTFIGYLSFEDKIKKNAKEAISSLLECGVNIKVLTGDNLEASYNVASKLLKNVKTLSSEELSKIDDESLKEEVEKFNLFYKLTPDDKYRIIKALKENKYNHTVGFMGDGINDAPSLKLADVGISFKEGTDIAKEASDVILTEENLEVLKDGIIEGRKSYINMMKYLKGQTSSNFGNMISQCIGAIWIPFIPMKALHIIMLDLITDVSCSLIPFDKVDEEQLKKPLNFDTKQIRDFMFAFGPISSLVDMMTFGVLMYLICPMMVGSQFNFNWGTTNPDYVKFMMIFQTGFFLESLITQNVVYGFLRTEKLPFINSFPSLTLTLGIIISCLIGILVIFIPGVNTFFDLISIDPLFILFLLLFISIYSLLTFIAKYAYKKKYGRLL